MPDFGAPSHIGLSVSDAESSARWYSEVLGLRRVRRANPENRVMIVPVHRTAGPAIGLNQHASVPVARFDDRNAGLEHIGFSVAERADLDAWEEQLTAPGVVHPPAQDTANGAPRRRPVLSFSFHAAGLPECGSAAMHLSFVAMAVTTECGPPMRTRTPGRPWSAAAPGGRGS